MTVGTKKPPWLRAVIKRRGPGIPQATMNVAPSHLQRKIEEKRNTKTPSCLIPHLLVVFTRQLEILVTTLHDPHDLSTERAPQEKAISYYL